MVRWWPGEAYPDTCQASRVGRYSMTIDEMQTPYVRPQEDGSHMDVRWATLTAEGGAGVRFSGHPTFAFTARRWTSEALTAAQHNVDLVPGPNVWVNLDVARQGIGSVRVVRRSFPDTFSGGTDDVPSFDASDRTALTHHRRRLDTGAGLPPRVLPRR